MPNCTQKDNWFKFFGQLLGTNTHKIWFKNINGGIYLSEAFFRRLKSASLVDDLGKAWR